MYEKLDDINDPKMEDSSYYKRRIVTVKKWRNPPVKSFLNNLYYGNWVGGEKKGYRNFFNYEQDRMTVEQTKEYFNWNLFKDAHYSALCVYPDWDIMRCSGESGEEKEISFRDGIRDAIPKLLDELGIELSWIGAVNAKGFNMVGMIVFSKVILSEKVKEDVFKQKKARLAAALDYKNVSKKNKTKRKRTKRLTISHCKKLSEKVEKHNRFTILEKCIPYDFTVHRKVNNYNMSVIEKILANSFYLNALKSENREDKIDGLIKLARDTEFELPIEFYSYRYLDAEGNLLTKHERNMLEHKRKMAEWEAENKEWLLSQESKSKQIEQI